MAHGMRYVEAGPIVGRRHGDEWRCQDGRRWSSVVGAPARTCARRGGVVVYSIVER